MINKNNLFLVFIFISCIANAQPHFCKIKNKTTYSGEVLHYNVFYSLAGKYIKAGEVTFSNTFQLYNQQIPCFHFVSKGQTFPFYDWIFKVRDTYESWVDTASFLPIQFKRNIAEGNNKLINEVTFNREKKTATSLVKTISIPTCVQDVLSTIYYARNIDFSTNAVNDKIPFDMYLDDEVYHLSITYLGNCILNFQNKKVSCIKFSPQLIEGTIFRGGNKMKVFVSNDERKIPIYIETPILVGSIKVVYQPSN